MLLKILLICPTLFSRGNTSIKPFQLNIKSIILAFVTSELKTWQTKVCLFVAMSTSVAIFMVRKLYSKTSDVDNFFLLKTPIFVNFVKNFKVTE